MKKSSIFEGNAKVKIEEGKGADHNITIVIFFNI